jgi:hypothetical protein
VSALFFSSRDSVCVVGLLLALYDTTWHACVCVCFCVSVCGDRPDVLSRYRVYMEGAKASFPTLLSNGNLLSSGEVAADSSRHFAVWEDPFPKPSYLFALVAGPLVSLKGK